MSELLIQYSAGTAFASALIRRLTHSRFSHCDILIPGEGLLGASGPDCTTERGLRFRARMGWSTDPGGVRVRPFNPWPYVEPPKVARIQMTEAVGRKMMAFAQSQIGKPFDNNALYAFLADRAGIMVENREWRDPDRWFCAEFVTRAAEVGGLWPYPLAITKGLVSPQDSLLLFNPYLANVADFL